MLDGGGGPEGVEHLWIKGRLSRIARKLGAKAVVEHSPTHGDVFLPEHDLVLEYQRWNTDFAARTRQRTSAGAARTIWMLPSQLPDGVPSSLRKKFDKEVFQNGGIYVSVLNPSGDYESQRPWEGPSQERTALLFASGSIAAFDPDRQALIYESRSLARILGQILSGERVLRQTLVWNKSQRRLKSAPLWALRDDLDRANAARSRPRPASQPVTSPGPVTVAFAEPHSEPESRLEFEPATELNDPPMRAEAPAPTAPDSPGLPRPANADVGTNLAPDSPSAVDVDTAPSTPQHAKNLEVGAGQTGPRGSWRKRVVDWLRLT